MDNQEGTLQMELEMDFLTLLINEDQIELAPRYEIGLVNLEKLCSYANRHIRFSVIYLPMLKNMSNPLGSHINSCPWQCVKEGSYYLGNAYDLVQFYKKCISGPVDNKDIAVIDTFLTNVGFDRSHITAGYTDEAYGGQAKCFVSKGQGNKYYELLHSNKKIHVRWFIELVEKYVEVRVENFLETMNQELQLKVFEAVKYNHTELEDWIKQKKSISLRDSQGRTLLHCAVNNNKINLVNTLLINGADINAVTEHGDYTVLHMASLNGNKEMVQLLLQQASQDTLFYLVNARMKLGCNTSLHVATMNGHFEIVKLLLSHGAMYNIKNSDGKLPFTLSKNQQVTNLLNLTDACFEGAKAGKIDTIVNLKRLDTDEFKCITNAHNNQGNTLLQLSIINNNTIYITALLELLKRKS